MFSGPDRVHGLPGKFTFVQCSTCGWIRQNPRPVSTVLAKYYTEDYEPHIKAIEDEKGFWNRWDRRYGFWKRCRSVEKFVGVGRLLEIGCGTGIFLNEMRRRGWAVFGLEPNRRASEYARDRFGVDVFQGTLEEFEAPSEGFDLICLWNVLEHLPTPAKDLKRMEQMLKRGGLLVMSIPNLESLDRKLFGESWIGWELPRHLYLFPRHALQSFLEKNGMEIVARECPAGSYYLFLLSLKLCLRDYSKLRWRTIDYLIKGLRQLPLRIMISPIFWFLDALHLSTVLTYYIRKKYD